ncbi:MAG: T9SS type A sorting domain-containing protein, partial [Flavobacteriales bacterium]|nr:T9SS type A sorting domain-containing protein [Flavobacteriales bacterium]
SDNSYMMIGNVRDSITNYGDALIVKTDSAGNQIWTKRIPSDQDVVIDGGLITNDSNCLIYGHEYDSITNDRQAFFSKLDTSGNTLWKKTYGDLNHESVYHTIELSDGTMIAIGAEWTGPNQSTGFMMKLSEAGDSLWWRTFGDTDTSINRFNSVTENGNGGFICTGESKGDMWLVNTDSLGCLISNCATGIANTEKQREEVSIYPVPFREKLKIEIEADNPNELMVSIANVLGQVVQSYPNLQMMPGKNVITLNTLDQHFSTGIYFISVTIDGLSYHFPAMRY